MSSIAHRPVHLAAVGSVRLGSVLVGVCALVTAIVLAIDPTHPDLDGSR